MPLISIVTINYNNAIGLKKTIASVVSQSFNDFEFIVIDGNSSDDSINILKQSDRINSWVSEKDNGIYHAQNKGIAKSTGDYLLFLNSGDLLADATTLEKMAQHLKDGIDIIYGDLITEDKDGEKRNEYSPEVLDVYHFMISTLWHPCVFIHKSVFSRYGIYNEEFKITADYEFFIRVILKNGVVSKHVNVAISIFNLEGISNNIDNDELQIKERKRSWDINFSPVVVAAFENYTKLLRSGEYLIGKNIKSIKNLFWKK